MWTLKLDKMTNEDEVLTWFQHPDVRIEVLISNPFSPLLDSRWFWQSELDNHLDPTYLQGGPHLVSLRSAELQDQVWLFWSCNAGPAREGTLLGYQNLCDQSRLGTWINRWTKVWDFLRTRGNLPKYDFHHQSQEKSLQDNMVLIRSSLLTIANIVSFPLLDFFYILCPFSCSPPSPPPTSPRPPWWPPCSAAAPSSSSSTPSTPSSWPSWPTANPSCWLVSPSGHPGGLWRQGEHLHGADFEEHLADWLCCLLDLSPCLCKLFLSNHCDCGLAQLSSAAMFNLLTVVSLIWELCSF